MDALYRDYILDHYKNPRNFGELDPHDLEFHDHNPLCGDELGVHVVVQDGKVADLRFHGHGCAISQAAASITSEELIGMPVEDDRQARRRLGDRPARHRHLPHAPQVRAARPEGDARRDDGRRQLAGIALATRRPTPSPGSPAPSRRSSASPGSPRPSSVTSTGTQLLPVRSRTGLRVGLSASPNSAPAVGLLHLRVPARLLERLVGVVARVAARARRVERAPADVELHGRTLFHSAFEALRTSVPAADVSHVFCASTRSRGAIPLRGLEPRSPRSGRRSRRAAPSRGCGRDGGARPAAGWAAPATLIASPPKAFTRHDS